LCAAIAERFIECIDALNMRALVTEQDNSIRVSADSVHICRLLFFFTEDVRRELMHRYASGNAAPSARVAGS
jgi:hypothetical protein